MPVLQEDALDVRQELPYFDAFIEGDDILKFPKGNGARSIMPIQCKPQLFFCRIFESKRLWTLFE